jgi:hypothetical protein
MFFRNRFEFFVNPYRDDERRDDRKSHKQNRISEKIRHDETRNKHSLQDTYDLKMNTDYPAFSAEVSRTRISNQKIFGVLNRIDYRCQQHTANQYLVEHRTLQLSIYWLV